ncbi:cobalamin B12-binding domain-containing protein [Phaeovulum vinaykumarii]|uniref:B12 binding domain-containing protein n=1 Tax=Phaeovulum vinaykumarii TaxID=407234 RepID=A0A1N7L3S0_9RHOB|nr:cobalamin-dependent protein [Phaeovulum vinaykumarii]SIS68488.1 B12 binding domain-containing protein [Phaeovulum vinaykumarii]SOC00045.1 B12 binding protein [Phaeovulum vinaykumarii]
MTRPEQSAPAPGGAGQEVDQVAAQVVALLSLRVARFEGRPREDLVARLIEAVLAPDLAPLARFLDALRAERIPAAALADLYIPEAARRMGHGWDDDTLSFVDVTVGVARLQALLREIGSAWEAEQIREGVRGTVLMLVPQEEQHTLGALVAANQLRRMGVSVCVRLGEDTASLRALIAERGFDAIMISAGARERVRFLRDLVAALRAVAAPGTRFLLGGPIAGMEAEILDRIGADFVTGNMFEALDFCGLSAEPAARRPT